MEEKRFALLIDSDNISAGYIQNILEEMTKYGIVTNKRIYGDWTRSQSKTWKEVLLKHSIMPMQQFAYTTGKNATDSFLIIDAMDILYSNTVDGFCLVTSDSDFTRLAGRLRESGKQVIGMGESKTPDAFRSACDRFICLDNIGDFEGGKNCQKKAESNVQKTAIIEKAILSILSENEDDGKMMTDIGEVGSRLVKMFPDFDTRNYGYSKFSTFCENLKSVKLMRTGNSIKLTAFQEGEADVKEYIIKMVQQTGTEGMELSALSNHLKIAFPDFSVKQLGFSQMKKFINSLHELDMIQKDKNHNMVIMK